ncbi:MAG: helix-hairpin-helix domain-containing protein [Bacteroidetes bacterium]|nr:helix-hairpin-helix domain-containing protein [Bacteroidota bacterium]
MSRAGVIALFLFSYTLFAQTNGSDALLQQKMESIAENLSTEDVDLTLLEERLVFYKENPLDINAATLEQLQQLLILNDIQINNLLNYVAKNGTLLDLHELQAIDGFDLQTIRSLLPYIKISDGLTGLNEVLKKENSWLLVRYQRVLESQKGYAAPVNGNSNYYLGDPGKLFARYRFENSKIIAGLTAEKDPGEQFFTGKQKQGFDFYSAHVLVKDIGKLKMLALGDYQLQLGQGLIGWGGFAFNRTADAIAVKRSPVAIRPHTSTDENLFFRGIAGTVQLKKIYVTGFVSRKSVDANVVDTLTNGEVNSVSSLQTTGEHATPSELSDKHSVLQTIAGGDISFKTSKFDVGAAVMFTNLSAELKPTVKPYSLYEFSGRQLLNIGLHYNMLLNNFNFFGEAAVSGNGSIAYLNGLLLALDKRLSLSLSNRNYQPGYQSLMGSAFSQGTSPANERGTYIGLQIKPVASITVNSYADLFSFPWLRYQISGPSQGLEYFTQLNYTPDKKLEIYGRFRIKRKLNDLNIPDAIDVPVPVKQNNYRVNYSYTLNNNLRLSGRVEWLTWQQEGILMERGFLMYQEMRLGTSKFPITLTLRYALFETDSYNSRIYAYESDIPFTYSIPAYYYKGSRVYCMLNYDVNKRLSVWLRYAQTFYDNQKVISAGSLNEISGNTRSDVKVELRYVF